MKSRPNSRKCCRIEIEVFQLAGRPLPWSLLMWPQRNDKPPVLQMTILIRLFQLYYSAIHHFIRTLLGNFLSQTSSHRKLFPQNKLRKLILSTLQLGRQGTFFRRSVSRQFFVDRNVNEKVSSFSALSPRLKSIDKTPSAFFRWD